MSKRNERGQFLPNDQLEPLVWERAEQVKEGEHEVSQAPNGESCAADKHQPEQPAFVESSPSEGETKDLAQHGPQTVTLTNAAGEEVVLMGLPTKRAKRGKRSNRCCVCGCETDTSKNYYCKSCWAEYQRNRYQAVGR